MRLWWWEQSLESELDMLNRERGVLEQQVEQQEKELVERDVLNANLHARLAALKAQRGGASRDDVNEVASHRH